MQWPGLRSPKEGQVYTLREAAKTRTCGSWRWEESRSDSKEKEVSISRNSKLNSVAGDVVAPPTSFFFEFLLKQKTPNGWGSSSSLMWSGSQWQRVDSDGHRDVWPKPPFKESLLPSSWECSRQTTAKCQSLLGPLHPCWCLSLGTHIWWLNKVGV